VARVRLLRKCDRIENLLHEQIAFIKFFGVIDKLDAAESVCSVDDMNSRDVLDLMTQLIMKSLVIVNQESMSERRYHLLEMIRQYAHEKLVQSHDEEKIRTLHLNYFLNLSTQAQLELRGRSRVDWMERLNDERNNLRAALDWAEKTDLESGLFLSSRLLRDWESSDLREGTQWLELFVERTRQMGSHMPKLAPCTRMDPFGLAPKVRPGTLDHRGRTDLISSGRRSGR